MLWCCLHKTTFAVSIHYDVCSVHLEKAATCAVIPQLVIGKSKDNVGSQSVEPHDAQAEETETFEFHWQQKVFSQVQLHTLL